jgi:ADP-ribosyl-[dinitrogen reductase] hydrolase
MKTSITDPIRVDWLTTPWRGRVGLTFAPGKKDVAGGWDRDLGADLKRLRAFFNVTRLVTLIEDHELPLLAIPTLVEDARALGIHVERLPIRDIDIPSDDAAVAVVVERIASWARRGENVAIHCRGGVGRTGTIGGCVLVAAGFSPAAALPLLMEARGPYCPETSAQRAYIEQFARSFRGT